MGINESGDPAADGAMAGREPLRVRGDRRLLVGEEDPMTHVVPFGDPAQHRPAVEAGAAV
jgi:hypothetical protein